MKKLFLPLGFLLFACGKHPDPSRVTDAVAQSEASPRIVTTAPPSPAAPSPQSPTDRPVPSASTTKDDRAAAIRGNQAFASRLYAKLRKKEGNVLVGSRTSAPRVARAISRLSVFGLGVGFRRSERLARAERHGALAQGNALHEDVEPARQ
jgi:hypothetical protein